MVRWDRRRQGDHAGSWEQVLVLLVRLPDLLLPSRSLADLVPRRGLGQGLLWAWPWLRRMVGHL